MDIVIGISHNENGQPQPVARVYAFRCSVYDALAWEGGTVNAVCEGSSHDDVWGSEQATWIAGSLPDDRIDALRCALRIVARRYRQDGIALTVGACEIVEA